MNRNDERRRGLSLRSMARDARKRREAYRRSSKDFKSLKIQNNTGGTDNNMESNESNLSSSATIEILDKSISKIQLPKMEKPPKEVEHLTKEYVPTDTEVGTSKENVKIFQEANTSGTFYEKEQYSVTDPTSNIDLVSINEHFKLTQPKAKTNNDKSALENEIVPDVEIQGNASKSVLEKNALAGSDLKVAAVSKIKTSNESKLFVEASIAAGTTNLADTQALPEIVADSGRKDGLQMDDIAKVAEKSD